MEESMETDKNQLVIFSPSDIQLQINSKIEEIQSKILISTGYCRVLIQKETWDLEDFLKKFTKITSPLKPIEDGECEICCEKEAELIQYCCHVACKDCWVSYISEKVVNHRTSMIECLKCEHLISDDVIKTFLDHNTKYLDLYENLKLKNYVKSQRNMLCCSKCPNIIRVFAPIDYITCHCGNRMCTKCFNEPHDPISCENLVKWRQLCVEIDRTPSFQWIVNNTKDCPKCYLTMEKNGGCNVMRCPSCRIEFRWNCFAERYNLIPHFCVKVKKRNRRRGDLRLRYYYDGFLKYSKKLETTTNEALRESETTLQWIYPFAYFLTGTNQEFRKLLNTLETKTDQFEEFLNQDGSKNENDLEEMYEDLDTQRRQLLDYCREEGNVWDTVDTVEMVRSWIPHENVHDIMEILILTCVSAYLFWHLFGSFPRS